MSFCCCSQDDSDGAKRRGQAPNGQSMKDRGNLTDDERAVDWWRTHQQEKDGENAAPAATGSLASSAKRMQDRNPLEKPYELSSSKKPLRPQNGDVLKPKVDGGTPTNRAVSKFKPELDPMAAPKIDTDTSRASRKAPGEDDQKITSIKAARDADLGKEDPPIPQKDPSAKYAHTASLTLPRMTTPASKKRDKSGKDNKAKRRKEPNTASDDDDHLSDVPSDVDSVTKERYLLACQMLKGTLTAKEKSLTTLEREFIMTLLEDYMNDQIDGSSVISEDHVSAVEQAALRLENDPLFQDLDQQLSAQVPPSPLTAASRQMQQQQLDMPKHRPAVPNIGAKKTFLMNPCRPRSAEDTEAADIVLLVQDDSDLSGESDDDTGVDSGQLVRFDGWNFHQSAEYPFNILGADDPRLQSRVLTPSIMEALRGFFPFAVSESNYWLKFSLLRDGASLATLLDTVRASTYTVLGVETNDGEVFGSFVGAPWRTGTKWFGTGEAFLWRLKKSRLTSRKNAKRSDFENEMEVYPYTGYDDLVQYCTSKTVAVGGGDWLDNPCPFPHEPRGIGFMIDGDLAGGESNSCATFANPRLCKKASASNEFSIANLEVWTLTPCLSVEEAAKLEVQKLFIEENVR